SGFLLIENVSRWERQTPAALSRAFCLTALPLALRAISPQPQQKPPLFYLKRGGQVLRRQEERPPIRWRQALPTAASPCPRQETPPLADSPAHSWDGTPPSPRPSPPQSCPPVGMSPAAPPRPTGLRSNAAPPAAEDARPARDRTPPSPDAP